MVNRTIKIVKSKIIAGYEYLVSDYHLTIWNNKNRLRLGYSWIIRHRINSTTFRWVVIVGTSIVAIFFVLHKTDFAFTQDILSGYLIAIGAMAGSAIAIVFTISIFLLQNAADMYSSQYFEVYIHDWKEKIVYLLVVIITIVFFGGGLYVGGVSSISHDLSRWITIVSLLLVSGIFILIDWQYWNVRSKINPVKAIAFIQKQSFKRLKKMHCDAKQLAKLFQSKDKKITEGMALATAYNHYLQPYLTDIDRGLENLSEIALRLAERKEFESSKRGFDAIRNILLSYFEIRKNSSLAVNSSISFFALESDSQSFLSKTFERLNNAGEVFVREKKTENASYLVDTFGTLATKAQEITFIMRSGENPILDHTRGYLHRYVQYAMREKDIEVVFQGARVLGNIAVASAQKGLTQTTYGMIDEISEIAFFGIKEKMPSIITDRCNNYYIQLIAIIIGNKRIDGHIIVKDILGKIAKNVHYTFFATSTGYLPNDFTTKTSNSKPYDDMHILLAVLMDRYEKITDPKDKKHFRSDLCDFFDELYMSLRKLSEDLKNADSVLVDSIGRLLFNVNHLIIDLLQNPEFSDVYPELKKQLHWNIHLPYWFTDQTSKFDAGSHAFDTLTDCVAKTGILAYTQLKNDKIVITCIESIWSLTKAALEKGEGGHGYDEPRILEKACYLGILALKHGKRNIFAEVVVDILQFENQYKAKYFSKYPIGLDPDAPNVMGPKTKQLKIEIMRWRHGLLQEQRNRMRDIMGDAESMMNHLVEEIDIDRFVYEVWHEWEAGTDFDQEMEMKFKPEAISSLVKTLKEIIERKTKLSNVHI